MVGNRFAHGLGHPEHQGRGHPAIGRDQAIVDDLGVEKTGKKHVFGLRQDAQRIRGFQRHRGGPPVAAAGKAEDPGGIGGRDVGSCQHPGAGVGFGALQERDIEIPAEPFRCLDSSPFQKGRGSVQRAHVQQPVHPGKKQMVIPAGIAGRVRFCDQKRDQKRPQAWQGAVGDGGEGRDDVFRPRRPPKIARQSGRRRGQEARCIGHRSPQRNHVDRPGCRAGGHIAAIRGRFGRGRDTVRKPVDGRQRRARILCLDRGRDDERDQKSAREQTGQPNLHQAPPVRKSLPVRG